MSKTIEFGSIIEKFNVQGDDVFGIKIPDGTVVHRLEVAKCNNSFYQFPAFYFWKLFVSMAEDYELKSIELCKNFKKIPLHRKTVDKHRVYQIKTDSIEEILKYFKLASADYVFAFCALEAYVNLRIDSFKPTEDDYLNLGELIKKSSSKLITIKTDLIRESSLEEKLFWIMPFYLKKKKIYLDRLKSYKSDFRKIQYVRNEIVHQKRIKIRTSEINGTYRTNRLWNQIIPVFKDNGVKLSLYPAQIVIEIIKYIEEQCLNPKNFLVS